MKTKEFIYGFIIGGIIGGLMVFFAGFIVKSWIDPSVLENISIIGFMLIFLGLLILLLFSIAEGEAVFLIQSIVRYLIIGGLIILILGVLDLAGIFYYLIF